MQANTFLSKIFNSKTNNSVLKILFTAFFLILVVFSLPSHLLAAGNLNGVYKLLLLNSDIVSLDTDGDQIPDTVENNSLCLDSQLYDTDGDGLSDSEEDINRNGVFEMALGETNPCEPDTDGDGIDDKWELDHGLNPRLNDANEDLDEDGLSNYLEYYFDTNGHPSHPNDINSTPPTGSYYIYDEHGRRTKKIKVK